VRKLIIHDLQWAAYADVFAEALGGGWRVVADLPNLEELKRELPDADALLAVTLPAEAREAARNLKAFLFPGAGILQAEPEDYPCGCAVVNVYEHGAAVAEYVMTAILMHVTEIRRYTESFRGGSWAGSGRTGGAPHHEACGRTVGLVGFGSIGQAVAQRALAFCMRVIAVSDGIVTPASAPRPHFSGTPADLPRILSESDFLVLACPLTPQTRGMLGPEELARMKSSAYLINVSRAEIVDERALYEALRDRRIAGAALDVWYRYPATGDELLHGSSFPFHELPNVVATPHMAGWTSSMVVRRIERMVENLRRYERGEGFERVVMTGSWKPGGAA
jgi:phosphoglycerate dehydrogenase-like enzyme